MDDTKHNRTDEHRTSQRAWWYSQDLHRFRPDEVPIVRGEPDMSPHP